MIAVALALSASLSWGCSDFLGGLASRRLATLSVLFLSQCAALTAFTGVWLVAGATISTDARFLTFAVLSGLAEAIALGAFYRGLAVGAMGVVAPIAASAAIVPITFGLLAGERPGGMSNTGIALALAGSVLVAWQRGGIGQTHRIARGVGLALLAALGFGAFFVAIDAAAQRGDVVSAVFVNRVALVPWLG